MEFPCVNMCVCIYVCFLCLTFGYFSSVCFMLLHHFIFYYYFLDACILIRERKGVDLRERRDNKIREDLGKKKCSENILYEKCVFNKKEIKIYRRI